MKNSNCNMRWTRIHFSTTIFSVCFLIALLLAGKSIAQTSEYHPETREIGLRVEQIGILNFRDHSTEYNAVHQRFTSGWSLFYTGVTKAHHYWRVGMGYGQTWDKLVQDNTSLSYGNYRHAESRLRSDLVNAQLGYGFEFKQLNHDFWNRLRFRAGATLAGAAHLRDNAVSHEELRDSAGLIYNRSQDITSTRGQFSLQLGLTGQVAYRIKGKLFWGMDWTVGPGIVLSGQKSLESTLAVSSGHSQEAQIIVRNSVVSGRMNWQNNLRAPLFFLSLAF